MIEYFKTFNTRQYDKLFKHRFNKDLMVSKNQKESKFFIDLVEGIEKQYKDDIIAIEESECIEKANNYIVNEKIRLEVNIDQLKNKKIGMKYIPIIFSSTISIFALIVSYIVSFSNDRVKLAIDNKLNESINQVDKAKDLLDIFSEYSRNMSSIISHELTRVLVIVTIVLIFLDLLHTINKNNVNINISFDKFCFEVLKKIEKRRTTSK